MTAHIPLLSRLPTFADDDTLHVVVETQKGSPNKYSYEDRLGTFLFKSVLPEGMSFPYDFGLIPSTTGDDGDPLDILVLLDAPAFPGCVVETRLLGVIEAEQCEQDGEWERNDRFVGVATRARSHGHIRALPDLRPGMLDEVEAFFAQYNELNGKKFRAVGRGDAERAFALVREGVAAFEKATE